MVLSATTNLILDGLPLALFSGIGSGEIVLVLVVMLLLFGPKQLPELAKTIGNALRGIRKATDDMKEEIGLDEIIDPRPRRVRQYHPPSNVPPSLQGNSPNSAPSRRVHEGPVPDPYVELPDAPEDVADETKSTSTDENRGGQTPDSLQREAPESGGQTPGDEEPSA